MKKYLRILAAVLVGTMLLSTSALACTGVYVGKDVSDPRATTTRCSWCSPGWRTCPAG